MAYTGKSLELALPFLRRLPANTWFDTGYDDELQLDFQANTLEEVKRLQALFSPTVWKREWSDYNKWWMYSAVVQAEGGESLTVRIFGVREAPPQCRPVVERRKVKKLVPTVVEEREVEEEVIVGWDCNGEEQT